MTGNPLYDQLLATIGASILEKGLVKATSFFAGRNTENDDIAGLLEEYSRRVLNRCGSISSLALKGTEFGIEELYEPLNISILGTRNVFTIDSFPSEMLGNHPKVFIEDTAGMGKSTISKFIAYSAIKEGKCIPIFSELRKLKKDIDIVGNLAIHIFGSDTNDNRKAVEALIKQKNTLVILDGFDEISADVYESTAKNISKFNEDFSDSWIVITSRPHSGVSSLKGFVKGVIRPLDIERAVSLIKKYDISGKHADAIISEIRNNRIGDIREFLGNPLLVSLLYRVFVHKGAIPLEKYVYYQQVYEALFEDHDLSKGEIYRHGKACKLTLVEFQKLMRAISILLSAQGVSDFSQEKMIVTIDEARKLAPNLKYKSEDVFLDLLSSVPLIVKDGLEYKWSHKSLQDYFAACYLCNEVDPKEGVEILAGLLERPNSTYYVNILDFFYEMNLMVFRSQLVLPMLVDYCKFYDLVKSKNLSATLEKFCLGSYLNGAYYIFSDNPEDIEYGGISIATNITHNKTSSIYFQYGNYIKYKWHIVNLLKNKGVNLIKETIDNRSDRTPDYFLRVDKKYLSTIKQIGSKVTLDVNSFLDSGPQGLYPIYRRLSYSVFEDRYILDIDKVRETIAEIRRENQEVSDAISSIILGRVRG